MIECEDLENMTPKGNNTLIPLSLPHSNPKCHLSGFYNIAIPNAYNPNLKKHLKKLESKVN